MKINYEYDVAIIGGGPAGLTCAIYAQRANLTSCFIEKNVPGGKIVTTAKVENYPGFSTIDGPDLAYKMFEQATSLGSKYIAGNAIRIEEIDKYKIVTLENNETIKAKVVVIAIGTENKKLNVPGEQKFYGRGVSYCAICDGMFFKNKKVAVIGSGNSATEESLFLSTLAEKVYLIIRGDKLKAEACLIDNIMKNEKIQLIKNTNVLSVLGTEKVNGIELLDKNKNKQFKIDVDGIFPFIGLEPLHVSSTNFNIAKADNDFIIVDDSQQTNVNGIFSIGDINNKKYRQISTAISDGTIAALGAQEYINRNF